MKSIHLGFEIGTGEAVRIPLRHMAVTGQTQEAGKTTTLEALVARGAVDGLRAVAFITKRGEQSFRGAPWGTIPPYFRERADWQFVASILEATMRERLKFERPWIIKASRGAKTLADVQRNVAAALPKAKGLSESIYTTLDAYLSIVVPQIERLPYVDKLDLAPGINIMNLDGYTSELQALVIRSVMEWVYQHERHTVVIVPEAWEFIPQKRGSPVLLAAEELIRKGAGLGNYMWLDSQDLAGVNVAIRKSVVVWLLGVQREENEVKRTLAYITDAPKPKVDDVMQLGTGEFYVCYGRTVTRVYVQPAWMEEEEARSIATGYRVARGAVPWERGMPSPEKAIGRARGRMNGSRAAGSVRASVPAMHPETVTRRGAGPPPRTEEEDDMDRQERERYETEIKTLKRAVDQLRIDHDQLDAKRVKVGEENEMLRTRINALSDAEDALKALRRLVGRPAGDGVVSVTDEVMNRIIDEVVHRLPAAGAVYQVAPVEKLRKDYQTAEVGRILEAVSKFSGIQKDVVALLEMTDGMMSQEKIAHRLGKGPGGWLAQQLKPMKEAGFLEVVERQGARSRLRAKIAEDLAHYQATDAEIEGVYQQVLAAISGVRESR